MTPGWWIIPGAIIGALLWFLMVTWAFGATLTYSWHPGGWTHVTLHEIHMARKRGVFVRMECRDTCYSSATFWLSYVAEGNGCVGKDGRFGFHTDSNGDSNRLLYPRGLRPFIKKHVKSRKFVYRSGAQIASMEPNIRLCK